MDANTGPVRNEKQPNADPRERRDQGGDAQPTPGPAAAAGAALEVTATLEPFPTYVSMRFGPSMLLAALASVGVGGWNGLNWRLQRENIVFSTFGMDYIPPLMAHFDFRGIDLQGRRLDAIDLSCCLLDGANLAGCSLRAARFWWVGHASFRGSSLNTAHFEACNLTGCDFRDADLTGATFDDLMMYLEEDPPLGLPPEVMMCCKAVTAGDPRREFLAGATDLNKPMPFPA